VNERDASVHGAGEVKILDTRARGVATHADEIAVRRRSAASGCSSATGRHRSSPSLVATPPADALASVPRNIHVQVAVEDGLAEQFEHSEDRDAPSHARQQPAV
jgi:hypothetical protein